MNEFYKNTVNLSEINRKTDHILPVLDNPAPKISQPTLTKEMLDGHTDEIIKILTVGYKYNINTAAGQGLSNAYIALIGIDSQYAGVINILSMIFPSEDLLMKYRQAGSKTVMERLSELFSPFTVTCEKINETTYGLKVYW